MTQTVQAQDAMPASKPQTVTTDRINTAVAAIPADATPQTAVAAFAAALGIQTPQQTEDAINAVGTDGDGVQDFVRAWMSAQHDQNAAGEPVTLHTFEEVTAIYRQWQPVLAKMISDAAAQTPPSVVTDGARLAAMNTFILANP